MSFNNFNLILAKVSAQAEKEALKKSNREGKREFDNVLFYAVAAWCQELEFSQDATAYIDKIPKNFEDLIDDAWTRWIHKEGLWGKDDSYFKKQITKNLNNIINNNITDTNFIVIIAFVVTAVGYILYILNQKYSQQTNPSRESQYSSIQHSPSQIKRANPGILVLVINASKEDILQTLKSNNPLTTHDAEALYAATQALWISNKKTEFSQFETWFSSDSQVREHERSEYDVYLVKIDIEKLDPGFYPNVNQLDRLDAFRRLAQNARQVIVSPRLSSKAYENKYFYNR